MPAAPSLDKLRRQAVATSLTVPGDLGAAIAELGFVQADPIRAPARAQDLILRQRVQGYRVGDLDRLYPELTLEEDFLYAYGFMPRATMELLHPRPGLLDEAHRPLLDFVRSRSVTHPRELEEQFGKTRAVNAWGGFSKATTKALQELHFAGHLRVVGRQAGIRLYATATPPDHSLTPKERAEKLILLVVRILAPISLASLGSTLSLMRRGTLGLEPLATTAKAMIRSGALRAEEIEGETYLYPADLPPLEDIDQDRARILAPFDPIVWDRRRFDHLWGWRYRFEAYVPPAQRKLGYYAMPLLWRDQVIGWVNWPERDSPSIETVQFVQSKPKSKLFQKALDQEISRMRDFLASAVPEQAPTL